MSFQNNFMYIDNNYGNNKKDFTLLENNNKYDIYKIKNNYNYNNYVFNQNSNKKESIYNFPLSWTCYKKKNGEWTCPMRGDK